MSDANLELARRAYSRWSDGDVDGFLGMATSEFEFVPAIAAAVEGGAVRGPDEFRRFFAGLDETWGTFRIDVEEFRAVGDRVFGAARLTAKGRGSALELDQPFYSVIWIRDGKIARMESFLEKESAEAAAETELDVT